MLHQKFSSASRIDFFLLLLILVSGIVLRFVFFDRAPFTHDEIHTLTQTNYSSVADLIEKGVKPDGHPPLLLLFVNYYVKVFGSSEMAVKFPFVVCGILSILLVYLVASKWFGKTAGLLTAAVVSTAQYTVMYSLIARHYSMGLLLTLLHVHSQAKFFEAEGKKRFLWLAAFVITGVACCYLHYFSLLFTAIVAFTGFLFVKKKNFLLYLIACLSIPLLFLPYLPVFFVQLGYKGIGGPEGWLGTPDSSFFLTYIRYIFHYSTIFILLAAVLFLFGVSLSIMKHYRIVSKYRLVALAWFFIPLLTAYFYSVKVNPILQYSILIFSFPYLLMFLFSFFSEVKPALKTSMVALVLCIGTVTLVYGRKHYELFYNQGIHKVLAQMNDARQQFGNDSVDAAIEIENYFLDYYNKNHPVDKNSQYITLNHGDNLHSFIKEVSESAKNYFVFGSVRAYPMECVQVLKEYFPYGVSEYKGHLTEIVTCSKNPSAGQQNRGLIFLSETDFITHKTGWNFDKQRVLQDSATGRQYFRYDESDEFGVEFKISLDQIIKNEYNLLHVNAEAFIEDTSRSPLLVMAMESFDKTVDWRAVRFSDFLEPGRQGKVYLSLRFSDIHIEPKNIVLKVYIWNKDKAAFNLSAMKVSCEQGNPFFYGLFEEF